jgi:AcrR family transcriptional regulator
MSPETRLLDAALACVARVGVSKTTLDDVARAAGCSRATLYRYHPGKQPLLAAAVEREAARVALAVVAATEGTADVEEAAVAAIVTAASALDAHPALRTVLEVEPNVVVPHLAFARCDAFLARAGERFAPAFEHLLDPPDAQRLAEWLARLTVSFLMSPSPSVVLTDASSVRRLVRDFVAPALAATPTLRG